MGRESTDAAASRRTPRRPGSLQKPGSFQNCETIHFCCVQPPSVCRSVTVVKDTNMLPLTKSEDPEFLRDFPSQGPHPLLPEQ